MEITAEEIKQTIQKAYEQLKNYELEKPVIICTSEFEPLYKKYCPQANIIIAPEVPEQGLYVVDKELRREINQRILEEKERDLK